MKKCANCGIEKHDTEFKRCSSQKKERRSRCRPCDTGHMASEYALCRDRSELRLAADYAAIQYAFSPDKRAAYLSAWGSAYPEKFAKYSENKEKVAAHNRNRRAREFSAEGKHTAADIQAIFEKQQGLCASCQAKLFKSGANKYHVDHIMPLALGGSNWPDNLQCLCPSCNISKGAKHPDEWAKQQGRLL